MLQTLREIKQQHYLHYIVLMRWYSLESHTHRRCSCAVEFPHIATHRQTDTRTTTKHITDEIAYFYRSEHWNWKMNGCRLARNYAVPRKGASCAKREYPACNPSTSKCHIYKFNININNLKYYLQGVCWPKSHFWKATLYLVFCEEAAKDHRTKDEGERCHTCHDAKYFCFHGYTAQVTGYLDNPKDIVRMPQLQFSNSSQEVFKGMYTPKPSLAILLKVTK